METEILKKKTKKKQLLDKVKLVMVTNRSILIVCGMFLVFAVGRSDSDTGLYLSEVFTGKSHQNSLSVSIVVVQVGKLCFKAARTFFRLHKPKCSSA